MSNLKLELNSYVDKMGKLDFMSACFARLKKEVDLVFCFGRCNSPAAEKAACRYYNNSNSNNRFFPVSYSNTELKVLSAVIAESLRSSDEDQKVMPKIIEPFELFSKYFEDAYLYGTGTCENYAIFGAYLLMAEFTDIELSIETLNSDQSHTYIRVHTTPEYIFDFWGGFVCEYTDTLSWNECVGDLYPRYDRFEAQTKTNIKFSDGTQLFNLAENVFSEKNEERRLKIFNQVANLVKKENQLEENFLDSYNFRCSGN